jgi:NAD(P)-dependent dehydrogenase (short-subunit alcohol dehydrogenase family)
MTKRFENQVALITGGSTGIGAAVGIQFAREGARVALAARSADRLAAAVSAVDAAGGEAIALACDVTDRASVDAAVSQTLARFGRIDVVLANAGFGVNGLFADLTTDDFRRQFETNFFGVLDTVYATLPHLAATKGRLGIVSSVLGSIARPTMSAYTASKFALTGLSEAIAHELPARGVSVTCISPGMVASDFQRVDNHGTFHPEWKDTERGRFVVPADRAAREIVDALYRRRFHAVITGHGRLGVFVNRHAPWLVRFAIGRISRGRLERIEEARRTET